MSNGGDWSPDEPLGTETFRQGDEAESEGERTDPGLLENLELDPSIDPTLAADDLELEELGAQLDDPERLVSLEGGMDDPDGLDQAPPLHGRAEDEGWDLSAPLASGEDDLEDA
jgi:hypothetical protein